MSFIGATAETIRSVPDAVSTGPGVLSGSFSVGTYLFNSLDCLLDLSTGSREGRALVVSFPG